MFFWWYWLLVRSGLWGLGGLSGLPLSRLWELGRLSVFLGGYRLLVLRMRWLLSGLKVFLRRRWLVLSVLGGLLHRWLLARTMRLEWGWLCVL